MSSVKVLDRVRGVATPVALVETALEHLLARLRWARLRLSSGKPIGRFFMGSGCRIEINGSLRVGQGVRFEADAVVDASGVLEIGDHVYFSQGVTLSAFEHIAIGSFSGLGEYVSIHDNDHGAEPVDQAVGLRPRLTTPVIIGGNVWVGAKATILRGVTIGDNAVIGANAVVTRDVPAGGIYGGVPAKALR